MISTTHTRLISEELRHFLHVSFLNRFQQWKSALLNFAANTWTRQIYVTLCFTRFYRQQIKPDSKINPLNAELNPTCHLPALVGAHHILHVSRVRVKLMKCTVHTPIGLAVNQDCSLLWICRACRQFQDTNFQQFFCSPGIKHACELKEVISNAYSNMWWFIYIIYYMSNYKAVILPCAWLLFWTERSVLTTERLQKRRSQKSGLRGQNQYIHNFRH